MEEPGETRHGVHWHDHALAKLPGLTIDQLVEAFNDPDRVVITPDPKSKTGLSYRVIGWSHSRWRLLTLVMLPDPDGGGECCLTVFSTKGRDRRLYRGEGL